MADEATSTETSTETTAEAVEVTALGGASAEPAAPVVSSPEAAGADTAKPDEAEEVAKPVVPEAYELKASEGLTLDAAAIELATPVFKELGLSNEQAQSLMPVAEQFAKSIGDNLNAQILAGVTEQRAAWLTEAKADPEIGGAKWDTSIQTAAKALDTLGFTKGSGLRVLLDESGLGNHPEMIRAFAKVGKAISEDNDFVRTGQAATGTRSLADTLYPKAGS